jgi:Uma2 family endonuclease
LILFDARSRNHLLVASRIFMRLSHRHFCPSIGKQRILANMTAAQKLNLVSVDDYLAEELVSAVKHEYLGGVVYAMAGGTNLHGRITMNISGALHSHLRGRKCQAYPSDTKIRVRFPTQTRFYYPDVSVICRSNPPTDTFQDDPVVIVEVLSDSTQAKSVTPI